MSIDDVLTLDEKFKTVKVNGYTFKIKAIDPMTQIRISQHRTKLQNGEPLESFLEDEINFLNNIARVDACTEEMPKGFNDNLSCANWPDIELINKLGKEIFDHTTDIQSQLKKNRPIE